MPPAPLLGSREGNLFTEVVTDVGNSTLPFITAEEFFDTICALLVTDVLQEDKSASTQKETVVRVRALFLIKMTSFIRIF